MIRPSLEKLLEQPSVEFDPKKHVYKNKTTGEFYTSCSTISDAWQKIFLQAWYAKECAEYAKAHAAEVCKMDEAEFKKFMDFAKGAAKRKSEQAKVNGSMAHKWMEEFIAAQINSDFSFPATVSTQEAQNAVTAFQNWNINKEIMWLASEQIVCSDKYKIAGTLDGIAIVDGIPSIMDFKTSSRISEGYLLQCAGYDIMLSETGFDVRQYIILRIPKDGEPAETHTVSDRKEIKFLKETFLHQREAHKYYTYVENNLKEKGKIKVDDED